MTDDIKSHTLRDQETEVTVLSIGCAVQDWRVGGRSVVLGYSDFEDYRQNPMSLGVIVGRVANRISGAAFELDGETYTLNTAAPEFQIHGGPGGLGWCNWDLRPDGDKAVELTLVSPDGDQGFPGEVEFKVRMELDGAKLTWDMTALPSRATPINLAQHLYFNLSGAGSIYDHQFQINADRFTPNNESLLPTGEILDVSDTRHDLRDLRILSEVDPAREGYDLNFALNGTDVPAATAIAPDGMTLRLWTDKPGLQFYTSNTLTQFSTPLVGQDHNAFAAFCMEAQDFPNALNTPGFGSIICTPDVPYRQRTSVEIVANSAR